MQIYRFDVSLCVTTCAGAIPVLKDGLARANNGYKDRLASPGLTIERFAAALRCDEIPGRGNRWFSQGSSADNSGHSGTYLSVFGVAWYGTARTRLHVRVVADRVRAPRNRGGICAVVPWGLGWQDLVAMHSLALVYPALWISPLDRHNLQGCPVDLPMLAARPWDADLWWHVAEWARYKRFTGNMLQRYMDAQKLAEAVENTFLGPAHPDY